MFPVENCTTWQPFTQLCKYIKLKNYQSLYNLKAPMIYLLCLHICSTTVRKFTVIFGKLKQLFGKESMKLVFQQMMRTNRLRVRQAAILEFKIQLACKSKLWKNQDVTNDKTQLVASLSMHIAYSQLTAVCLCQLQELRFQLFHATAPFDIFSKVQSHLVKQLYSIHIIPSHIYKHHTVPTSSSGT